LAGALSLGLLLVALLLLGTEPGLAMIAAGLLLLSIAAGIAQAYHAWRVGLDASLLQLLRDEGLDGEAAARRTDQLLHDSGLRRAPPDAPLRGWDRAGRHAPPAAAPVPADGGAVRTAGAGRVVAADVNRRGRCSPN
jgi:hypothetical protein